MSEEGPPVRLGQRLVVELVDSGYTSTAWRRFFAEAWRASLEALHEVPRRRMSAFAWSFLALALGVVTLTALSVEVPPETIYRGALLWLPWALLSIAFVLLHLGMVRSADGEPGQGLLVPNGLTLIRLCLAPLTVELLPRLEPGSTAAIGFAVGLLVFVATDSLDGVLARMLNQRSELGRMLDPIADIALFGFLSAGLFRAGLMPWFVLVLFLLRYPGALLGALLLTMWRGPAPMGPTIIGKVVTAITSVVLVAAAGAALVVPEATLQHWIYIALSFLVLPLGANLVFLLLRAHRWSSEQRR